MAGTRLAYRLIIHVNEADKRASNTRLLIVDDEPAVRDALERVLRMEGFEVVSASSCREALECLHSCPVGLILLDINVSSENGWDLCRQALVDFPDLLVIAITAKPGQEAEALEFGADALMEKPLDLPRLLKTINDLLAAESFVSPASKPAGIRPFAARKLAELTD